MKFFESDGLSRKVISGIFILKIGFGIILWLIYSYYYTYRNTGDAFRFFDDAVVIFNATKGNFIHFIQIVSGINAEADYLKPYLEHTSHWYRPFDYGLMNDDRTLIRFNAIVLFFSFGYYQVHNIFMNFFSLMGLVALYKSFVYVLPARKTEILLAVFFIPTVLFWGSGVIKEGLLLFSLGMFVYSFGGILISKISTQKILLLVLSLFLLTIVKVYVLVCLLPAVISLLVIQLSGNKNTILKVAGVHVLLILMALNIHHVFHEYNVLEILQVKQRDFYNVARLWQAGSAIDIGRLEPNLLSFIKHFPQALATTFLRPHLLEAKSSFLLASALENLAIIALLVFYAFHFIRADKEKLTWILAGISFVVFLALLIGWTTPIMGAVVRYKLPLLPFVLFILFLLSEKPKIISGFELWIKSL